MDTESPTSPEINWNQIPYPSVQSSNLQLTSTEGGNVSEIVAKIIIEKIISKIVSKEFSANAENKVGDHCFDFLRHFVTPWLTSKYIMYEFEDESTEWPRTIFYSNQQIGSNAWDEIPEPAVQAKDRCEGTQIKYKKPLFMNEFEERNQKHDNTWSVMNIESNDWNESSNHRANNKWKTNVSSKTKHEKIEVKEKIKEKEEEELQIKLKKQKELLMKLEADPRNMDKDLNPIIDLPSYDLPNEVLEKCKVKDDNTPELNWLRSEREQLWKKIEEQELAEEERKKKEHVATIHTRYLREFDGSHYTFDSNGNIIYIRQAPVDIVSNEFYWSKSYVRDRNGNYKSSSKSIHEEKDWETVRETERNEIQIEPGNTQKEKKTNKRSNITVKDNTNLTRWKSVQNVTKRNSITNRNEEPLAEPQIKRPRRSSISGVLNINSINKNRRKSILDNKQENIIHNPFINDPFAGWKIKKMTNNNPIQPAGANFEIMCPEIGVVWTSENKRKKEGGLNYSNKYNKPSMKEFSKFAVETANMNTLKYWSQSIANTENNAFDNYHSCRTEVMRTEQWERNNKNINNDTNNDNNNININIKNDITDDIIPNADEEENYIGYKEQFTQNNNPLAQGAHQIAISEDLSNMNNNHINSHRGFSSNQSTKLLKYSRNYNTEFLNSIKWGKKNRNLSIMINDGEQGMNNGINNTNINRDRGIVNPRKIKNVNWFKKDGLGNKNGYCKELEIIDKFNSQIIHKNKEQKWGGELGVGNSNYFKKPVKTNHIKELGFRLVTSSRWPRQRKEFLGVSSNVKYNFNKQ